ncbi:MAG: hypothetical protein QMC74_15720 [Myxococcota bacterium]|jgi:hypothetical protein
MSEMQGKTRMDEGMAAWSAPSEPESYIEHQAALDATLFRHGSDPYELVLELESGELRVRDRSLEAHSSLNRR